jgi:hypothetical protein
MEYNAGYWHDPDWVKGDSFSEIRLRLISGFLIHQGRSLRQRRMDIWIPTQ